MNIKNKQVLVVDDDPMIRHIVQTILEAEGFNVSMAENGADGIAALSAQPKPPFTFMVLDMMMPKMNGLEVLSALRANPALEKLPVIMLTAEGSPDDILNGYGAGADYYITKPFTREQLLHGIDILFSND